MANQRMPGGFAGRALAKMLAPGEPVLGFASGKGGATLVATDRRAIILKGSVATGRWFGSQTNSYGYNQITSIEVHTGMLDGYVEITTGGVQNRKRGRVGQLKAENTVPFNKPSEGAFRQVAQIIQQHLYAPPVYATAAAGPDIPTQIAALAQLRDQGAITPAEYERKKAELLARM